MTGKGTTPLVIMAAGHGTRSGLASHQHKMLQHIGGRTILARIVEAARNSAAVGEIILDMNSKSREAAEKAAETLGPAGQLHFSEPRGYLADFIRWGQKLNGEAFIVDADVYTAVEQMEHFFDYPYSSSPGAPALAHTSVNESNREDPRSAWVRVSPGGSLLNHARGEAHRTGHCTIGLWKTSPTFIDFLSKSHDIGLTSITAGVDNYLGQGQQMLSPLVEGAVNVNAPRDLDAACALSSESLVS